MTHYRNTIYKCDFCKKDFLIEKYLSNDKRKHFCSRNCCNKWKKDKHFSPKTEFFPGMVSIRKGSKVTEETKQKLREARAKQIIPREAYEKRILPSGLKHWNWKNKPGYRAIHCWVERVMGKPKKCEKCGEDNLIGHKIHWANISGNYLRDTTDWIRLCVDCHFEYDKRN
jgi:hypothetical protein